MASSASSFLSHARKETLRSVRNSSRSTPNYTIILGNSSADIDSYVSALLLSYFCSRESKDQESGSDEDFIPILNLPNVPASDLYRLRPELGTVLRLAANHHQSTKQGATGEDDDKAKEEEKELLGNVITIDDIRSAQSSALFPYFSKDRDPSAPYNPPKRQRQPIVLVDHNALSMSRMTEEELETRFSIVGCIDHHVDEKKVPEDAWPRTIMTGVGSCTSLVVKFLRGENLWPESSSDSKLALMEMAKLALAAILVDTANLKAKGDKCADLDREAVKFLESQLDRSTWDRDAFFQAIFTAKISSLNLLKIPEMFERDYKEWNEDVASSQGPRYSLNIGISSLVQLLPWLIGKAGSAKAFISEICKFALETEHMLSVFALITKGIDAHGKFAKELVVVTLGEKGEGVLKTFEERAGAKLQLKEWKENDEFLECLKTKSDDERMAWQLSWRVWWQGDVSQSRKQVAPLLREATRIAYEGGDDKDHPTSML